MEPAMETDRVYQTLTKKNLNGDNRICKWQLVGMEEMCSRVVNACKDTLAAMQLGYVNVANARVEEWTNWVCEHVQESLIWRTVAM